MGPGALAAVWLAAAPAAPVSPVAPFAQIGGGQIQLEYDRLGGSRIVARLPGAPPLPLGPFRPAEVLVVAGQPVTGVALSTSRQRPVVDELGPGARTELAGESPTLRKEVTLTTYEAFPAVVVVQTRYTVLGPAGKGLQVDRWIDRRFLAAAPGVRPPFWSYQGASYANRPDWVLPLRPGFYRRNHMGMNATDYGGGTPVADVWRPDLGLAVGHLERTPRLLSLPVSVRDRAGAEVAVEGEVGRRLAPGESVLTARTFVAVHRGDHFQPLAEYRRLMAKVGVGVPEPDPGEGPYAPIWCGWGYGRTFTPAQIEATLGKAADLGFKWAVIDDGWQTSEGDWHLDGRKFPAGDADMRALTGKIRAAGLRPMLWWAPLAADPGTDLLKEHPDYLLLGPDGKPRKISWWDSYYLCPAYAPVKAYTRDLVTKMLRDWGYEGLKLDGQHLNGAPPCHNPAHGHASPNDAFEKLPELFQLVFDTARSLQPEALVELCPCGTGYAFHTMPFFNMPAASDPESSWQVRSKGKTLKALMGPSVPYFGDHVELSEGGLDFASTVGVGGVIGTQFTLPGNGPSPAKYRLTPAKEALFRKWTAVYNGKLLARGEYLGGLYDIGYDRPEAHAIRKDGRLYYAFFARRHAGPVQLRGLEPRAYCLTDYVEGKPMGTVQGPTADLSVRFEKHLLLEATPKAAGADCPQ